jgi:hypothetical protein
MNELQSQKKNQKVCQMVFFSMQNRTRRVLASCLLFSTNYSTSRSAQRCQNTGVSPSTVDGKNTKVVPPGVVFQRLPGRLSNLLHQAR